MSNRELLEELKDRGCLKPSDWQTLLSSRTAEDEKYAAELARETAVRHFGKRIFFRGIIEFTNICKNDCYYCGIRRSNSRLLRYRLTEAEIMACCEEGYELGFRTFVLQGGEDGFFTDEIMTGIIRKIKKEYPDCAITLSLGERSRKSYELMYEAGADRYLLRHETADSCHYSRLHPESMSFQNRMSCLKALKEIGYQTGCGMMVGSPYQTMDMIVKDMVFLQEFRPEMVGMGPFISHKDTPFSAMENGSSELTLFLLSLVRLMLKRVLLPATTALGTLNEDGRIQGLLRGCNVIMPNLSPGAVRDKYLLYDNKAGLTLSPEESLEKLKHQVTEAGYEFCIDRGDYTYD